MRRINIRNSDAYNRVPTFEIFDESTSIKDKYSKLRILSIVIDDERTSFNYINNQLCLLRKNTHDILETVSTEKNTELAYLDKLYLTPTEELTTAKINNEIKMLYKTLSCPYISSDLTINIDDYIVSGIIGLGNRIYIKKKDNDSNNPILYTGLVQSVEDGTIKLNNVYSNHYYSSADDKLVYEYNGITQSNHNYVVKKGFYETTTGSQNIRKQINNTENVYYSDNLTLGFNDQYTSSYRNYDEVDYTTHIHVKLETKQSELVAVNKLVDGLTTTLNQSYKIVHADSHYGYKCYSKDCLTFNECTFELNNIEYSDGKLKFRQAKDDILKYKDSKIYSSTDSIYGDKKIGEFKYIDENSMIDENGHIMVNLRHMNVIISVYGIVTYTINVNYNNSLFSVGDVVTNINSNYICIDDNVVIASVSSETKLTEVAKGQYNTHIEVNLKDKTVSTYDPEDIKEYEEEVAANTNPDVEIPYPIPLFVTSTEDKFIPFYFKDDDGVTRAVFAPSNVIYQVRSTDTTMVSLLQDIEFACYRDKINSDLIKFTRVDTNVKLYTPSEKIYKSKTITHNNGTIVETTESEHLDSSHVVPVMCLIDELEEVKLNDVIINPYDPFIDSVLFDDIDIVTEMVDENGVTKLVFHQDIVPVNVIGSDNQVLSTVYSNDNTTNNIYSKYIPEVCDIEYVNGYFTSHTNQVASIFKHSTKGIWNLCGISPFVINDIDGYYKYASEYITEQVVKIDGDIFVDTNTITSDYNTDYTTTIAPVNNYASSTDWLGNQEGNIVETSTEIITDNETGETKNIITFKLYKPIIDGIINVQNLMAIDENGKSSKYQKTEGSWVYLTGECDPHAIVMFVHIMNDNLYYTRFSDSGFELEKQTVELEGLYNEVEEHQDLNDNNIPDKFEQFSLQSTKSTSAKNLFTLVTNKIYNVTKKSLAKDNELCLLFTEHEHPESIINAVTTFGSEFNLLDNNDTIYVKDDKIVIHVNRVIDISDYESLKLTIDSPNHYPFKSGVVAKLTAELIK